MKPLCQLFGETSRRALEDPHLQVALRGLDGRLRVQRDNAFEELPNGEELRDEARAIREHTLAHLDRYLVEFEENFTSLGGVVHWAGDAAAARGIIQEIARVGKVKRIVKGKSMVSEEIGLNKALEAQGLEVVETDLGEFIIQVAGEPPSHLVAPAVHKTRAGITELFNDALGAPRMEDPEALTLFARKILQEKFLQADMGITGANFTVARTGGVVLLENEGNIRLSTTIPRIHVAVTGIEKVVPTWSELAVLLKLLPRSATGQKLSSYVSIFLGPGRQEEPDGAEEFHLVLLDNGRSRILKDPALRESLRCIRCGACLNTCPVYLKAGGHAWGWVYSGPIGSVLTPQLLEDRRSASGLPFASTLCGACFGVCPVRMDIPRILTELRRRFAQDPAWGPAPKRERGLFGLAGFTMGHHHLFNGAGEAARRLMPVLRRVLPLMRQRSGVSDLSAPSFRTIMRKPRDEKND